MGFPSRDAIASFGARMESAFSIVRPVTLLHGGEHIQGSSGIETRKPKITAGEVTEVRAITFRVPRENLSRTLPDAAILTVEGTGERWRISEIRAGRNADDPAWIFDCEAVNKAQ
jgi:hypothetical protein